MINRLKKKTRNPTDFRREREKHFLALAPSDCNSPVCTGIQCVSMDSTSFVIYPELEATEVRFSALKRYLCSFYFRRDNETGRIQWNTLYIYSYCCSTVQNSSTISTQLLLVIALFLSHKKCACILIQKCSNIFSTFNSAYFCGVKISLSSSLVGLLFITGTISIQFSTRNISLFVTTWHSRDKTIEK